MIRYLFASFILIHGLIHFMGFAKAFNYGRVTQLTKAISKPLGALWFLAASLFIAVSILFLFKKNEWVIVGIISVIVSQAIIITDWKDAKFATIANAIILAAAIKQIFSA